ncbi:MAG: DUF6932 family protein [Spirochaetota bacterium]
MNKMIHHYSINEFSRKFCFNRYRRELFSLFCEEMQNILRQSSQLRILVFGSFITKKERPSDIDVLISIIPTRESSYRMLKKGLARIHKKRIDVKYSRHQMILESCESLINTFNTNKLNKEKKISIDQAVEVVMGEKCPEDADG